MHTSRWKGIPKAPRTASKLYTPLRMLMNGILLAEEASRQEPERRSSCHYEEWRDTKHVRRVLATHAKNKRLYRHLNTPVSPTLYLAGGGFQIMGVDTPFIEANSLAGIAPIEVLLDSQDLLAARDRLVTNVSQMFCDQSRRRFAFGVVMTETTCTVYMFDHSGAVASQPFDYHQRPAQFCAIIFWLGCNQCDRLGFDRSILNDSLGNIVIRTRVGSGEDSATVFYAMKHQLFHFSSLIGRGIVYWRTMKACDSEPRYVIKDAWMPLPCHEHSGQESEGSLLRHAQAQGVVDGVARLEHFEHVQRSDDPSDLDTVLTNRQVSRPTAEDMKLELIHTRIVLRSYGKPLNMFYTRKELLLAFRDAVFAHRRLHDVAGILHRDISIENILINPGGAPGNRGILINFDYAIRVGDTSHTQPRSRLYGTRRYMSCNVLEGKAPHIYRDDLESFYYVLCWILMTYTGPQKVRAKLPVEVEWWSDLRSSHYKRDHFVGRLKVPVDPWFGPWLRALLTNLFVFFQIRGTGLGGPAVPADAQGDYVEYIGHIDQCIHDMEDEG
ncbi:hypothetical protein JB92DRAFT_3041434 [Gautieria morchelliformis]|nr:hypothetical protein JB92DRAFT_3041434 [Gautieria morchelliformis]